MCLYFFSFFFADVPFSPMCMTPSCLPLHLVLPSPCIALVVSPVCHTSCCPVMLPLPHHACSVALSSPHITLLCHLHPAVSPCCITLTLPCCAAFALLCHVTFTLPCYLCLIASLAVLCALTLATLLWCDILLHHPLHPLHDAWFRPGWKWRG